MAPKGKRRALYEMFDATDPGSRSVPQTALRRPHMHQPEGNAPASTEHATPPPPAPAGKLRRAEPAHPAPMPEPKIAPRPTREDGGFPLAPGRSVRVPSGYLFFGGALIVGLLITAFALGHARGERAAELRIANDLRQADNPDIVEPLNGSTQPQSQQTQPQPQPNARTSRPSTQRPSNTPAAPPQPTRTAGGALIITRDSSDPRTPGENYLFVALRGPEEAIDIAEFLTANDVPAAVFESNRPTLRQVVALRGFAPDAIRGENSNDYQRFRQNIRDLGREWATRTRGSQNFDDLYPVRYSP